MKSTASSGSLLHNKQVLDLQYPDKYKCEYITKEDYINKTNDDLTCGTTSVFLFNSPLHDRKRVGEN